MSQIDTSTDAVESMATLMEVLSPQFAAMLRALEKERNGALEACRLGAEAIAKLRQAKYELEQAGTFEQGVQASANVVNQLWLDSKDRTDLSHTAVLHLAHHNIRALIHPDARKEDSLETIITRLDKTRQTLKSDGYKQGGETIGSIVAAIHQLQELSKK